MSNNYYSLKLPINLLFFIRRMKVVFCFLWIGALSVWATDTHSQNATIHIRDYQGLTLENFIREVESQTNYLFVYRKSEINIDERVSLPTQELSVKRALDNILANTEFSYSFYNDYIVLTKREPASELMSAAIAQGITITGTITDQANESLPGVSVLVRGTTIGVVSDANGRYSIQIPDRNAVLVFSFVGMKKVELPVNSNNTLDVKMQEERVDIDEVIVLGYTTSKRREAIGSIAKVTSEQFATPAYGSIQSALQGKLSGVYVTGGTIRIRGMNSINRSTEPIWIIDGVQGNGADLNPNDIESVTVLKDANATALYGSQGSNGVIVVTTKSFSGKGSHVTVEYDGGVSQLMGTGWKMMDSKTFLDTYDTSVKNTTAYTGGAYIPWNQNLAFNWNNAIGREYEMTREEALKYSHKGIDEYTRNAVYHQLFVSANKGFDKGNALFTLTYRNSEPINIGGNQKKLMTRTVLNYSPLSFVNFSFQSINQFNANNNEAAGSVLLRPPFMPIYDEKGRSDTGYWGPGENPIIRGNSKYCQDRNRSFSSSNFLRVDIDLPFVRGLRVSGVGSAGFNAGRTTRWWAKQLKTYQNQEIARAEEEATLGFSYRIRGELSYNRTFSDHTVGALAIAEANKNWGIPLSASGYNLTTDYPMLGTPGGIQNTSSFHTEGGGLNYIGRLTYNYKGRYLLEGSIRRDGLSVLSVKNRWATFYSVGAGWILSDESFWKISAINLLKIRGSYGLTGNADVPSFVYLPEFLILSRSSSSYEEYLTTRINRVASDVKWETSDNFDIGIDFGILNNRINGSIAYFDKEISGLLLNVPQPPSAGNFLNGEWANIGNMRNNGIEFNADANVLTRGRFSWNTSFNYTFVNNKVLSLYPELDKHGTGLVGGTHTLTKTGGKLATYYVSEWAGIDPQRGIPMVQQRDADIFKATGNTVYTGKLIPASQANCNGNQFYMDGKSYIPSYFGGWRNTFRYGMFDLNLTLTFSGGNYYFDYVEWRLQYVRIGQFNLAADLLENSWKKPGDVAKYQELIYNGGFYYNNNGEKTNTMNTPADNDNPNTSNFLKKGDNVQLKEITLGINFPNKWTGKVGLDNARVFFNINNALYWTKGQKLGNPDVSIGQNNINGVQRGESFMTRTFSLGVSVKF